MSVIGFMLAITVFGDRHDRRSALPAADATSFNTLLVPATVQMTSSPTTAVAAPSKRDMAAPELVAAQPNVAQPAVAEPEVGESIVTDPTVAELKVPPPAHVVRTTVARDPREPKRARGGQKRGHRTTATDVSAALAAIAAAVTQTQPQPKSEDLDAPFPQ
jgi:hypothetical protein